MYHEKPNLSSKDHYYPIVPQLIKLAQLVSLNCHFFSNS
jgi:hypothetical protein